MNAPRPLACAPPRTPGRLAGLPDRRGEALVIFTTIFIRPALELRSPARHLVNALAHAGARRPAARPTGSATSLHP
jgi:hypothetical protein